MQDIVNKHNINDTIIHPVLQKIACGKIKFLVVRRSNFDSATITLLQGWINSNLAYPINKSILHNKEKVVIYLKYTNNYEGIKYKVLSSIKSGPWQSFNEHVRES